MTLIYQEDQTKLWELEYGIPRNTGLDFVGDKNWISTETPIKTSGVFYVQLVFANTNLTLEVTIHEKAAIKESLLGGQENHVYDQNFDRQYRYGIQLSVKTATRLTLNIPEEYPDLKLDSSSLDKGIQKFRFASPWMEVPATDWGIINLCTALLIQVPGYALSQIPEEKVVEISPLKELAAVS